MLYLALAFCIVMPIFGVAEMENGAVSPFIAKAGGPNGATFAYLIHILVFFLGFAWVMKRNGLRSRQDAGGAIALSSAKLDQYALVCAAGFIALAMILLFGFGGRNVLSLAIDKAEFRTSLGPFGVIISLATKWYIPAMFAVLMRLGIDFGWTRKRVLLTVMAGLGLVVFGAATGFKTTIVQMLLPTFIVCAWKITPRVAALGAMLLGGSVIGLAVLFDGHDGLDIVLDALWYRMTVLQSDLTWYTWEIAVTGGELPNYLRTFLPVFGDSVLRALTGVDPNANAQEWASYYYGLSMTLFGGYPMEGVLAGVNNQATLFAESVVIGGVTFFPLVSFVFGMFSGRIAAMLKSSIQFRSYARCGTLSCLFSFTLLMWTLGNGLSSFVYLINIFGFATTYLLITVLLPVKKIKLSKAS